MYFDSALESLGRHLVVQKLCLFTRSYFFYMQQKKYDLDRRLVLRSSILFFYIFFNF